MRYLRINKAQLFIFFIFIFAFILRLYRLCANDFWYDEVNSVFIAQEFFNHWNPPLYFIGLYYWIKAFGVSEFALRFPSLVFGAVSVIPLFLFTRRLFGQSVAVIASLILSVSAFNIWYAQEARPYTLQVFLSLLSTYILYRAITEAKKSLWLYFSAISVLGLYSNINYFHFFLLIAQFFLIALYLGKKLIKRSLPFFTIFVLFLPFLPHLISKLKWVQKGFWILKPTLGSLLITLENYNLGYNSDYLWYFCSNIFCLLLFIWAFISIKQRGQAKNFIAVLTLFALPIFLIFLISKFWISVYLDRGLIIFSPYYYIILALGIDFIRKKTGNSIVILIFGILFGFPLAAYYKNYMKMPFSHHTGAYIKKPFKPAVSFIDSNSEPGDFIGHTNPSSQAVFSFYTARKDLKQNFIYAPGMIDSSWQHPFCPGETAFPATDLNGLRFNRLWLVASDWPRSGILDENSKATKDLLDKGYKLDFMREFDGLWIFRYVKE